MERVWQALELKGRAVPRQAWVLDLVTRTQRQLAGPRSASGVSTSRCPLTSGPDTTTHPWSPSPPRPLQGSSPLPPRSSCNQHLPSLWTPSAWPGSASAWGCWSCSRLPFSTFGTPSSPAPCGSGDSTDLRTRHGSRTPRPCPATAGSKSGQSQ